MPLPYKTAAEGEAAIKKAAREAGLDENRIGIPQTYSADGSLYQDHVVIYFPIRGKEPAPHHAKGTYAAIIAAISDSQSFDELAAICKERGLLFEPQL